MTIAKGTIQRLSLATSANDVTAAAVLTDNQIVQGAGGARGVDSNATGNRVLKGWFTDIESTNVPTINGASIATNPLSVYAAGTAYALTATPAALDFGTTDPVLTLTRAGTYLIMARAQLYYNAATFVANRTTTIKLRRTNNTAADLTSGSVTATTSISVGALSQVFVDQTWQVLYTTTNTDDAVTLFGSIDVAPGAGSVDAVQASIVAVRLVV